MDGNGQFLELGHPGEILAFDDEGETHWYSPKELLTTKVIRAQRELAELDINRLEPHDIELWLTSLATF